MQASDPVRKYYVRFFPGTDNVKEVDHNNPQRISTPKDAFAFQFESSIHVIVTDGNETHELVGGKKTDGPKYYVGGKVYTLDEIKTEFPQYKTFIDNMEVNGWNRVIQTSGDNWQPFTDECILIEKAA